MNLQVRNAIDDPDTSFGHLVGPFQIGFLIKPGFQLNKDSYFLPVFGGINKGVDHH